MFRETQAWPRCAWPWHPADIDAGAPIHGDGTINLMLCAAWLVKEMANRGD